VKKSFFPLSVASLLYFFLLLPVVKAGSNSSTSIEHASLLSTDHNTAKVDLSSVEEKSKLLYERLQLGKLGLAKQALTLALKGQQKLVNRGIISNSTVLTVCDFSQPSDHKRMYIIDVSNARVLLTTYVAHGKNSGLTYAKRFSNRPESLQSSLGFYVTKGTYFGEHGLSLRLSGQDRGFNDKAEARAVVVHGADYIGSQHSGAAYMGRSFGCPAVPSTVAPKVINLIKNGTCLFIYHPSKNYLRSSKILNG
jgi:hypothetical protein